MELPSPAATIDDLLAVGGQGETCDREDDMYVQAMDGDGTSRRAATGGHEVFAAMMMVSEDKNKNTLVVARAKRGARLGCQKQRSIIIIEPDPSSALPLVLSAVLGTFQSLAAPPAACRLIFPNTRLIITHPPPALPRPLLKDKEHHLLLLLLSSPTLHCPALLPSALLLDLPVLPAQASVGPYA